MLSRTLPTLASLLLLSASIAPSPAAMQINPIDLRTDPDNGLYTAALDDDTITWPPGNYYIGSDAGTLYCFILHPADPSIRKNRTNLTINASGVNIVVTDPSLSVFFLHQCHGLLINGGELGFTITYDPLPFNQSTILAVNTANNTFDVQLDAGYLGFDNPFFSYELAPPPGHNNYGVLFDPNTTLMKAGTSATFMRLDSYQQLVGSGVYRLTTHSADSAYLQHFVPGDRFVYVGRRLGVNVFNLNGFEPTNRDPLKIENCTAYAGTSLFMNIRNSPNFSSTGQAIIRNCKLIRPSSERLITAAACLFATNCRVGPLVEGCTFERMSDDGFDFHGDTRLFQQYPFPGDFTTMDLAGGPRLAVADSLQFFFPQRDKSPRPASLPSRGEGPTMRIGSACN